MKYLKYLPYLFILALLTSCSSVSNAKNEQVNNQSTGAIPAKTQPAAKTQTELAADKKDVATGYILQPGDVIHISVWKEKDLQREVVVRPDGKLNFPLVGEIQAAGLTFEQFKESFTVKLSRYIPHPVVTVSIKQAAGNKIFVTGKVNRPGEYPNNRNLDVMQALSLAGGLNPFASEKKIKILRRENGKIRAIPFNYKKVKKGKNLEQNIILKSGDIIVVR